MPLCSFWFCESGVVLDEIEGVYSCDCEQVEVVDDVCDFEVWQAVLTGAEEFAGAAEFEVVFRYFETVLGAGHDVESALRGLVLCVGEEEAV